MAYDPQYVSIDDVPVQIPDDYSPSEKEDALEYAEASLELDLNDGAAIPSGSVSAMMKAAVKQLATCQLAKGAEHPDDITLGDLNDTGDTKVSYAESFCDEYEKIVDKLVNSGALEDLEPDGQSTSPYVYNTDDPTPGNRWS
ncbi:hypothetical protein M199_gp014 [Halogranum tailed virus 1]|uniref:Uncharacterized protein n=1 Tax=Halogranum tailed virus 1 TaxID=1273749 RepID=R4T6L7_9CAUD|nr:hypothetical protein M199_gp014 [Halogranum tailed virus 1]AGM11344.1 hypothetical protein HGTV1_14 [Halogranum tailed virus 1]